MPSVNPERLRRTVRAIADLAPRYRYEFLHTAAGRRDDLDRHWFQGLLFFLEHVYPQGRNDDLSIRYYRAADRVLHAWFPGDAHSQDEAFTKAWNEGGIPHHEGWWKDKSFRSSLLEALLLGKAGKRTDAEMVVDSLRFIQPLPDHSIIRVSRGEIRAGRVVDHWQHLQTIRQVGPKTASLYLRDVCSVYSLTPRPEELVAILPVDTWVRQICEVLNLIEGREADSKVRQKIVALCAESNVSPADFDCGAWYVGRSSFRLAIELLGNTADGEAPRLGSC